MNPSGTAPSWRDYLSFRDLAGYPRANLGRDLISALSVAFLAVPQGVAYAMIAGLPPRMGLYAATFPTVIGSLFRSSRHVVTGPTNAVSLLVGTAVAAQTGGDPVQIAVSLALLVAALHLAAGLLRLGVVVDYLSSPVVLGYITGAGILIAVGQLPNVTATVGDRGALPHRLMVWVEGLGATDPLSVAMALGTAGFILLLRRINRRLPGATLSMIAAIAVTRAFDLDQRGLKVIADLSPISASLPSLTMPDLSLLPGLVPLAVAVTVLSLAETTAVARSIASRSGQRLDLSAEFVGEGLSNLVSSFVGGYPTTGSLSRSALNEREGATSRLSGVFSGVFVLLAVLLAGDALNATPIASLAGLLLVVAAGLIDTEHIRRVMRSHSGDRFAFATTVAGTFVLHLDQAIYLGVLVSLAMYLRRARLLSVRDLVIDDQGRLREVSSRSRKLGPTGFESPGVRYCAHIHVLNVTGSMFFAAAAELQTALDQVLRNPHLKVLILRLKHTRNIDVTSVDVLVNFALQMRAEGRSLMLVGLQDNHRRYLERMGAVEALGKDALFPREPSWFAALESALQRALGSLSEDEAERCPFAGWLATRDRRER